MHSIDTSPGVPPAVRQRPVGRHQDATFFKDPGVRQAVAGKTEKYFRLSRLHNSRGKWSLEHFPELRVSTCRPGEEHTVRIVPVRSTGEAEARALHENKTPGSVVRQLKTSRLPDKPPRRLQTETGAPLRPMEKFKHTFRKCVMQLMNSSTTLTGLTSSSSATLTRRREPGLPPRDGASGAVLSTSDIRGPFFPAYGRKTNQESKYTGSSLLQGLAGNLERDARAPEIGGRVDSTLNERMRCLTAFFQMLEDRKK